MNLYIIEEVLYDYTPGMVVIAAKSLTRARDLFSAEFGCSDSSLTEFDQAIAHSSFKVLQVVDQEEGVVSYVYGGS